MKVATVLDAVVQELPEEIKQDGAGDVAGKLFIQALLINGGVITFDVSAKNKGGAVSDKVVMDAQGALSAATVTLNVFAQGMDRKLSCKNRGQHFQYQCIP
ncbi:hypothetical protein GD494_14645 [Salmonella enterica]|nr:hypothetical protein [Salmonella enterica]